MKDSTKKKAILALGTALGLNGVAVAANVMAYDKVFSRYNRPDYSLTPGNYEYKKIQKNLPREEFFFKSNKEELKGYYYKAKFSKGLVVVCHGMHAGNDDYLPLIEYLVKNHYSVFGFDYTGTYDSKGESTIGMCQSLIDLDYALNYIKEDSKFKNMPVYLLGHSWGGYAATSILCIHKEIKAVAVIAPMYNGYTMIVDKTRQYAGSFANTAKPFINTYQKFLFRKYTEYDSIKGINSVDIPVLIAQGVDDKIITYEGQSIIAHKEEITNKNVTYYITKGIQSGHNDIMHSLKSIEYQKEVASELKLLELNNGKPLTDEQKREFYSKINHSLYSEVNKELMDAIIKVYKKAK